MPDVQRELVHVQRATSTVASITPLSDGRHPQTQESNVIEPDFKGGADSAGQPERRGEVVVGNSPACIARVTHDVVSWEVTSLGNQLPSADRAETLSRPSLEQEASTRSMGRVSAGHGRREAWGHASVPASANAGAPPSEVEGWRGGGTPLSFLDGFLRFTMLAGADDAATRSGILGPLPCTHSETPLNNNREAALHTAFADKARLRPDQVEKAHQVGAAAFSQPIPASVPSVGLEIDSAPPHQVLRVDHVLDVHGTPQGQPGLGLSIISRPPSVRLLVSRLHCQAIERSIRTMSIRTMSIQSRPLYVQL